MYNAHWIHSLPYSKFIELTLKYQYAPFVTGMVILMAIPAALAMLYARVSPFGIAFMREILRNEHK